MLDLWQSLNNRDIALLIWGSVFLVFAAMVARSHVKPLLRAFLSPKVSGVFLALLANAAMAVWGLWRVGLWEMTHLKDSIVWFLTVACVSVFQVLKARENPRLFWDLVWQSLGFTAAIGFITNTYVLSLGWELFLVPAVSLVASMSVVADHYPKHRVLRRPLRLLLTGIGFALAVFAFRQLYLGFGDLLTWATAKQFLLAPTLTFLSLPTLYLFALWAQYEEHFLRIGIWLKDKPELIRYAKRRTLVSCGLNLARLGKLKGEYYVQFQESRTEGAVAEITRKFARRPKPRQLCGEVVRTRIVPYKLPANGQAAQMVLIDWKNTSDEAVNAAFADIVPYDADGERLPSGAEDYCIYRSGGDSESEVEPGQIYVEPEEQGFILLSSVFGQAARVEARITRLIADH